MRTWTGMIVATSVLVASGCASYWPEDTYPTQDVPVADPYGRDIPRPAFEFERERQYDPGPAFREETASERQQRVTAERLADVQRTSRTQTTNETALPERRERRRTETLETRRSETLETRGMETLETRGLETEIASGPRYVDERRTHVVEYDDRETRFSPTPVQGANMSIPPMPSARAGECYAMVRRPEQYRTVKRRIIQRPAYERLEVEPARYGHEKRTVTVQEPYERLEIVPATFKTVTERVMVREATTRYEKSAPRYETRSERVMVQPPRQVWKPGRGAIERIDHATGEIMCLVEEPAKYETVSQRVLVEPAQVREVDIPAQYRTIERRVIDQPARVRRVRVPAKTRTIRAERVTEPASVRRVRVPAEYATVSVREVASPAQLEWRSILCETNMSPDNIRRVQRALRAAGFDPGPIDGVIGGKTMRAVNDYQKANGLPVDRYLNMQTVRHLGVDLR